MKKTMFYVLLVLIVIIFSGCPVVFNPLEIPDQIANEGKRFELELTQYTNAINVENVTYKVESGVGEIEGTYYVWDDPVYEDDGKEEVVISAENEREVKKEDSFTITVNSKPKMPNSPDPSNGATDVSTNKVLEWDCSDPEDYALTYDIYFGEDATPLLEKEDVDEKNYDPGKLKYETTYYWKIVAEDELGAENEGPIWTFTTRLATRLDLTVTTSPDTGLNISIAGTDYESPKTLPVRINTSIDFEVLTPQEKDLNNYVEGNDTRYTFTKWNDDVEDAERTEEINEDATYTALMDKEYKVETATNPENLVDIEDAGWYEANATQTFAAPEVPDYNFEYWEINESNESTESTIEVTIDSPKKIVAFYNHIPTLSIPDQEVDEGNTLELNLNDYASDPDGDTLNYSLTGVGTITNSTYSYNPGYDESGTYEVTIGVNDGRGGESQDSFQVVVNNVNRAPEKPHLPSPENNAKDVSVDNLTLSWECTDPDGDELEYDLYFDTSAYLGYPEVSDYPATSIRVSDFYDKEIEEDKTYYWRVVARDEYGEETEGNIWFFTTGVATRLDLTVTTSPDTGLDISIAGTVYESPKTLLVRINTSIDFEVLTPQEKDSSNYVEGNDTRYTFTKWNDDVKDAERTELINEAATYTALMDKEYKVETATNPENLVDIEGAGWYEANATQTFTAPEVPDYNFEHWEINESNESTESTIELTIDSPKKIVAHYNHIPTLSIPDQEVDEGNTLELNLNDYASDPDGDTLNYSLTGVGTITNSTYSYNPGYDESGTYEVTIGVSDGRGGESQDSFQVVVNNINRAPDKPHSPSPENNAEDVSIDNLTLSWECSDPDGDELEYDLYFDTFAYPGSPEVSGYPATSIRVSDFYDKEIEEDKTYYWRVVARDEYGEETEGDTWSFKTVLPKFDLTVTTEPDTGLSIFIDGEDFVSPKTQVFPKGTLVNFGVLTPQEKDSSIYVEGKDTRYTFDEWSDGFGSATRTEEITEDITYTAVMDIVEFKVETATSPEDLVDIDGTDWYEVNATQAFAAPEVPDYNFEYWEINESKESTESTIEVTIDSPKKIVAHYNHIPTINIPDQEVDEGETLELNLDDYASDTDGDPLTYSLETGVGTITDATYTYNPGYDASGTYPVTIEVNDGRGGKANDSFVITVNEANAPPSVPSNPYPSDGATDIFDPNLVIEWDCSDPEGDELVYDVYFGETENPPKEESNHTEWYYNVGSIEYDTTYYWQIVAKDGKGGVTEGPVWSFSTAEAE